MSSQGKAFLDVVLGAAVVVAVGLIPALDELVARCFQEVSKSNRVVEGPKEHIRWHDQGVLVVLVAGLVGGDDGRKSDEARVVGQERLITLQLGTIVT